MSGDPLDRSYRLLQNALHYSPISQTALSHSRTIDETPTTKSVKHSLFRKDLSLDGDLSLTMTSSELRMLASRSKSKLNQKSVFDRLFVDFMESWQRTCASGSDYYQDVFESITDFVGCCIDTLDLMKNMDSPGYYQGSKGAGVDVRKLVEIESEKNTWKLVYTLYKDRIDRESEMEQNIEWGSTEGQIVERMFKINHSVREWQMVVDWLEGNASEQITSGTLEKYTDKGVAWENTLHQLQNQNIAYKSTREFITEMDPDAPRRQQRNLHDIDQEDEDRLEVEILKEIRSGRLDEAQILCNVAGQAWRAATLEGWRPYHDSNFGNDASGGILHVQPPIGNPFRDIWKHTAYAACSLPSTSPHALPIRARAALAANCGHLPSMLAVAQSWEDHLWCHLRTQIDIAVEREIRDHSLFKEYLDMPREYWNCEQNNLEEIFSELSASKNELVRKEASLPDRIVHKYLILDQIPQLMQEMSQWIRGSDMSVSHDSKPVSPHFLRFLAHLVLFLKHIGRLSPADSSADSVLEAYVKLLIEMRESSLVAWYVSHLPAEDQTYYYASYLEDIVDSEERSVALQAAQQANLNIDLITKTVVENVRQQPSIEGDPGGEDLAKISALDWLLFHPRQRLELLIQANALIGQFLGAGNVQAARAAFNKIPEDSLDLIQPKTVEDEDVFLNVAFGQIPRSVALATKEYLCYKAYLDADESFSDWFQHFHSGKPAEPVLPGNYTFLEKVAFQHKHKQYLQDLERWKGTMESQTAQTRKLLSNVLTFPLGWLMDTTDDLTEDPDTDGGNSEDRAIQLNSLRANLLPRCAFLLHTVLHSSGDYVGCIALADLIAAPHLGLFKVFSKQKLKDLLIKIGESSLELMNQGKDPWGCPLV